LTAKKRWVKYINVFKTINRLKKAQVKPIDNPDDIVREIERYPSKQMGRMATSVNNFQRNQSVNPFNDKIRTEEFFKYIAQGGDRGIKKL